MIDSYFFFFNDTATTEIYTLSLHDALPIYTVVNERGKFILNLLPSGILRSDVVNVIGNGVVVDIRHLAEEINKLRQGGIEITPSNLKISDRAIIVMPYHVQMDCLEEERLLDAKYGSTKRGKIGRAHV